MNTQLKRCLASLLVLFAFQYTPATLMREPERF